MKRIFLSAAAVSFALATFSQAFLINADINGDGVATMSGAALFGTAGDLWNGIGNGNDFDGVALTGVALLDAANGATGVTLDVTTDFIYDAGGGTPFASTSLVQLFQDFTGVSNANVGTFTLHNLTPGLYDLVVYATGDNNDSNGAQQRLGNYTANGITQSIGPNNGANALAQGVNYARFSPTVGQDGVLSITFSDAPGGSTEADINGFQLQSVPEPATALLGAAGLVGLLARRRR